MDEYDEGSNARHAPDAPPHDSTPPPGNPRASAPGEPCTPALEGAHAPTPQGVHSVPEGADAPASNEPHALAGEGVYAPPPAGAHSVSESAHAVPECALPPGLAALSLPYQVAAALALAVVAVTACVHLGMVFLHVAPPNTLTKQHGRAIDAWIYPEFEQNWKLFAPDPLQQNVAVQVRADVRTADGSARTTGWYDLSALDGKAIDGNPLPSHTQQNELRRAWDLYAGTHDGENRPAGLRGVLSERYLLRIVVLRLDREHAGGKGAVIERVQVRSSSTNVQPPKWSGEKVSATPMIRQLPWWPVSEADQKDARTEASAR